MFYLTLDIMTLRLFIINTNTLENCGCQIKIFQIFLSSKKAGFVIFLFDKFGFPANMQSYVSIYFLSNIQTSAFILFNVFLYKTLVITSFIIKEQIWFV